MVTPAFSSLDNPYIVGKPLRGGLEGRDDVLAYIQQTFEARHGQVVLLYGQRRIGKTSILFSLEKKLDPAIYQPIYVDMQDSAGLPFNETLYKLASYVNKVTLRLKPAQLREGLNGEEIEPEDYFKELFLPKAFNALGERRLVLLLDEVDTLDPFYNKNMDRPEESTAWRIFQFFRSLLREHPRLSLVVVMGRSPASLSEAARNALIDSSALRVTYLDRAYAENLIRLAERQGMVRYDPASIPAILTLTNGHPYFTQLLCSEIYIRCYQEGSGALGPCPTVTPEIVEGALQEVFRQGRQVLENVWDSFDLREQLVMAMVAELTDQPDQPLSKAEILEGFNQKRIPFTLETLADIPDHLMDQGYFQRDTSRTDLNYCFRADLLRRWVRTEKPLDKVRQEIDRLDPVADSFFQQARQAELAGNTEEAVDDYKQAIERNPEHIRARLGLGQLYLRQAQNDSPVNVPKLEAGMEVFRDAYRRTPALVKADLGHTLRLLAENASDEETAFHYYEEMLSLFPGDSLAVERIEQLGTKLEQAGRLEQAREYFIKLGNQARVQLLDEKIQRSSRIAALLLQVTEVTRPGGEFWDQAVPLYQELVELQPEFPAWNLHLANARKQMRLAELYTGAQVAYKAGRYAIAVAALHEITQTQPDYRNTPSFLKKAERQLERQQRFQDLRSNSWRGFVVRFGPFILTVALVIAIVVLVADLVLRNNPASNSTPTSVAVVTTAGSTTTQAAATTAAITGTSSGSLPAVTTAPVVQPSMTGGGGVTPAISTTVAPTTAPATTIVVPTTAPPAQAAFGPVQSLVYNPASNELAAATQAGDVAIIDFSTGKIKTSFKPETSSDNKSTQLELAYSPDGKSLALGQGNGKVAVYSADSKKLVKSVEVGAGEIQGMAYSPDGKYLVVAASLELVLLDTTNFSSVYTPIIGQFTAVAFSPDSQTIAAARTDNSANTVQIYSLADLQKQQPSKTLNDPGSTINALAYSADSKYLAVGSKDRSIYVYSPGDYKKLFTLIGHNGPVNAVRFAPDNDTLASGSDDKTVKLWTMAGQKVRATFSSHTDTVTALCFNKDGSQVISASLDGTVRVWDATSGKPLATNGTYFDPDSTAILRSLASTQDGKKLAIGRQDGTIRLVVLGDSSQDRTYTTSGQPITAVGFSQSGELLVAGSTDGRLYFWNLKDGNYYFIIGPAAITGLAFSPDGNTLAVSASSDDNSGYIALYNIANHFEIGGTRLKYSSSAYAVSYSSNGSIALALGDGTVRIFQPNPFREQTDKKINVAQGRNYSVAFSPDSKFLAVGTSTGAIYVTDLTNGQPKTLRDSNNNEVRALAFSPDSKTLATGSIATAPSNSTVHLWDVATGQELANFSGVSQGAYGLTFIPGQKILAVAVYNDPTGSGQQKVLKFINIDNSSPVSYPT